MNIRADETSQGTNEGTTKESTFVAKRSGKVKALKPLNGTAVSALVALQELTNTKSPRQMNGLELNLFSIYLQKYQEATGSTLEDLLRDPHLPVAIREQIKETLDKKDKDVAQATAAHLAQEDMAQKENLRQRYEDVLRELAEAERHLEEARVRLIAAEQELKLAEETLVVAQKDLSTAMLVDEKATQELSVATERHEKSKQDFVGSIVTDIRNASPEEKRRLFVVAYKMGLRDNVAQMLSDADKSMLANIDFTIYKKKGVSLEDLDGLASDTTKKHFEQFSNTQKQLEHCKQNKAKTQASVRNKQEKYESAKKDKSSKEANVKNEQKRYKNFYDAFNKLNKEVQKMAKEVEERWKNPSSDVESKENLREKIRNFIGNTEEGRGNRGSGGVSPSLTPTQGTNKGVESKSSTEQQPSVRNKKTSNEQWKNSSFVARSQEKTGSVLVDLIDGMGKKLSSEAKSEGMGENSSSEAKSEGVGENPSSEAKSQETGGVLDVLKNHSQGDSQRDSTRVNNSVSNTR